MVNLQSGRQIRRVGDQIEIEAFVDDPEIAELQRSSDPGAGIGPSIPRGCEMRDVDARRKSMDIGVAVALGLIKAEPAREDHIGAAQQLPLALQDFRGGTSESRKLVHHIEDDEILGTRPGERRRHRCIVPVNPLTLTGPG